jgi:flagella basal body P-ring formation protein FlgA
VGGFVAAALAVTATLLGTPCLAAGEHDRARALVESYARAQTSAVTGSVEITVGPIDSRARMPACRDLQTLLPPVSRLWGPSSVGVRCTQPEPGSVYLPVTMRVTGAVLVTTRAFAPGHRLVACDFALRTEGLTRLPPMVLVDPQAALGQVLASAVAGDVAPST